MLEFKGKKIMVRPPYSQLCVCNYLSLPLLSLPACRVCVQLDCGIHPGLSGMDALPYTDMIDAEDIDLLLITQ